uniref:Uncharacterized protein n=1 Tax=Arundo donax TaxID=35708 RepID=A0A0A9GF11_ARUDO
MHEKQRFLVVLMHLASRSGAFSCKWTKLSVFMAEQKDISSKVGVNRRRTKNKYHQLRPLEQHSSVGSKEMEKGKIELCAHMRERERVPSIF